MIGRDEVREARSHDVSGPLRQLERGGALSGPRCQLCRLRGGPQAVRQRRAKLAEAVVVEGLHAGLPQKGGHIVHAALAMLGAEAVDHLHGQANQPRPVALVGGRGPQIDERRDLAEAVDSAGAEGRVPGGDLGRCPHRARRGLHGRRAVVVQPAGKVDRHRHRRLGFWRLVRLSAGARPRVENRQERVRQLRAILSVRAADGLLPLGTVSSRHPRERAGGKDGGVVGAELGVDYQAAIVHDGAVAECLEQRLVHPPLAAAEERAARHCPLLGLGGGGGGRELQGRQVVGSLTRVAAGADESPAS
mmetsp:Transcript_29674/g.98382  ORF Transcript_29674/g.98382 Transcript_29674/m.98382 type:complete len:305 (-) Transcript_29674:1160-2074(-)